MEKGIQQGQETKEWLFSYEGKLFGCATTAHFFGGAGIVRRRAVIGNVDGLDQERSWFVLSWIHIWSCDLDMFVDLLGKAAVLEISVLTSDHLGDAFKIFRWQSTPQD